MYVFFRQLANVAVFLLLIVSIAGISKQLAGQNFSVATEYNDNVNTVRVVVLCIKYTLNTLC